MANEEANRETVSTEAHDRAKNDLAKLETENTKLQTRIEELSNTVVDSKKMELARDWLMGQGAVADAYSDANQKATFVLPHLREVEVDKIGEVLNQDQFKFLTSPPVTDTTSSVNPKKKWLWNSPQVGSPALTRAVVKSRPTLEARLQKILLNTWRSSKQTIGRP